MSWSACRSQATRATRCGRARRTRARRGWARPRSRWAQEGAVDDAAAACVEDVKDIHRVLPLGYRPGGGRGEARRDDGSAGGRHRGGCRDPSPSGRGPLGPTWSRSQRRYRPRMAWFLRAIEQTDGSWACKHGRTSSTSMTGCRRRWSTPRNRRDDPARRAVRPLAGRHRAERRTCLASRYRGSARRSRRGGRGARFNSDQGEPAEEPASCLPLLLCGLAVFVAQPLCRLIRLCASLVSISSLTTGLTAFDRANRPGPGPAKSGRPSGVRRKKMIAEARHGPSSRAVASYAPSSAVRPSPS